MATPNDVPQKSRRKSLLDIGRALGLLSGSDELPKGFDEQIAPVTEELHLTPRSRDISPRSASTFHENTSQVSDQEQIEDSSSSSSPRGKTLVPSRTALNRIKEEISAVDGHESHSESNGNDLPSREALFEPDSFTREVTPAAQTTEHAASSSRPSIVSAQSSFVERRSDSYSDVKLQQRFANLPQYQSYSQTTPNPRTNPPPLSGAFSFFSKLFNPLQESPNSASSSTVSTHPTPRFQSRSNDTESMSHTPLTHTRLSSDTPRTTYKKPSTKFLSTRPTTLPPKSAQEESKHREQYLQMLQAYEAKEEAEKQKSESKQKAKDARIMQARTVWTHEILPHWEKKKRTKPVHELVLQGIPPFVRTKVWPMLIGNDLHVTNDLFNIYVKQAEAAKALRAAGVKIEHVGKLETARLIGVDLPRTFPALAFYQEGGPNHAELHRVLDAYVCYRPDIGYVQGMSYLAAILLLYLDDATAFTCLANLLNRNVHLAFFKMDVELQQYASLFETLFKRCLPDLYHHFETIGLSTEMYLLDWFLTIFSKSLPLDIATHLWDIYIFEGQSFLFRAALGLLKYLRAQILAFELDLVPCKHVLARIPEDTLDEDSLLASIASISLREHEDLLNQLQIPLFKL